VGGVNVSLFTDAVISSEIRSVTLHGIMKAGTFVFLLLEIVLTLISYVFKWFTLPNDF